MRAVVLLFAACVFPIHVWSIVALLRVVPAWLLRMSAWDLIGAIAYVQAFSLLESAIALLILVFLGVVLPSGVAKDRLVALGSMAVLLTSLWAVAAHLGVIRLWENGREFLAWSMIYLASVGLFCVLVRRSSKLERLMNSVVERLIPLSVIYVCIDILSVAIVILRNVLGAVA
jgi:hypothetical protein